METKKGPRNLLGSLTTRLRPYQFNWIGRTKQGVNRWIGAPKGPTERMCNGMIGYGIAACLVGLIAMAAIFMRLGPTGSPLGLLALIGGIHGVLFSTIGLWLRKTRRNLARLKTADELAVEFGSTPETVRRMAEAHSIRPHININNDDLYEPDEFLASRSLLRGASMPVSSATLLRPVEPRATRTTSETLLRAVEPATEEPILAPRSLHTQDSQIDETAGVIESRAELKNERPTLHESRDETEDVIQKLQH